MAKRLEDFIKDYLADRSAALGAKGYAKWISEYAKDPSIERAEAIARADTSYKTALSGYGKSAERLAERGLANSGYAEYLNALAKQRQNNAITDATLAKEKNKAKVTKEYESYLDGIEDDRLKRYEKAVRSIQSDNLAAYGAAYERALSFGLDEESASRAATEASKVVKATLKQKLLSEIATKRLTSAATRAYALTLGLDQEAADELAEYAHRLNESVKSDETTESYLEYLKNLLNKKG